MKAQGFVADTMNQEEVMASAEYFLDSLTEMDRYIGRMASATGPAGILDAVGEYLAGWSRDRILGLQKIDAGWAPFDEEQQPVPLYRLVDVLQICDSVRSQCVALRESGVTLTPELLELDLFFFFVRQIVEDFEPALSRARAVVLHASRNGRPRPILRQVAGSGF